jgi:hypothetical protein
MATPYVLAEYIWLDAWGRARSKTKVIPNKTTVTLEDMSDWNYDGSSTGQAPGTDSVCCGCAESSKICAVYLTFVCYIGSDHQGKSHVP